MTQEPRVVIDRAELVELYQRHPRCHLYALADLQEPYWSASTWWRRGDAAVGLIGLGHDEHVIYALSSSDVPGTLELLAELAPTLPNCQVVAAVGSCDVLEQAGRTLPWRGTYTRFHLADRDAVPDVSDAVRSLTADDLKAAEALYATDSGAAFFLPNMLDQDTFVGLHRDDLLVAIAGTHAISDDLGVAALGAIFCHPGYRGQGLGKIVTAGAIRRIANRVETIGLNCADSNTAAIAIYTGMGFDAVLKFEESEIAP